MPADFTERIKKIPIFETEDADRVAKSLEGATIALYKKDEFLCREGEYNENCLILLDGEARIEIGDDNRRSRTDTLAPGALFGEIAALTGTPRTADIIANQPVTALSIPRITMFSLFDAFPGIKTKIDDLYRKRALATHLLTIPIFAGASEAFIESLAKQVSLITYQKGEVIFNEGEEADAFYLIRYGFVKVSHKAEGKEKTVAYLKEGSFFGEVALIRKGERRTASVSAINRAEVVRLSVDHFRQLIEEHPVVRRNLVRIIKRREERNREIDSDAHLADTLRLTIESGVIQTKAVLIMDTTRCVHCDNCVDACASLHGGASRLVRRGSRFNNFILVPTSCRHCEDPTCMSDCPTGAITRDASGEIYHKDFCIGCGGCAKNCPYDNITIVERTPAKTGWFSRVIGSLVNGGAKKEQPAVMAASSGFSFIFPGDRDMVERPIEERLKGDRDQVVRTRPGDNKASAGKKAVKCDMCREFEYMGCVYHCPTGAARRVDPTKFFADVASIG